MIKFQPLTVDSLIETVNAHLPAAYHDKLRTEYHRVEEDVLRRADLKRRKVLLVGGAGYVGSVATAHLLNAGYAVRCLDNLIYAHDQCVVPFLSHPDYEFLHGDITDRNHISNALYGITDVVLLAGLVGDPITKNFPEESARTNDDGYTNIIMALDGRGLNKVVFISTCSNYGLIKDDELADELQELSPLSLYAKSKVRIEQEFLSLAGKVDFTPTILRFATAFGLSPRMRFDLTVSEFTRALALGEDLMVYDAATWRPYCHLQDFSELIRRVLEAPLESVAFEVFNAGGDVNNYTKQMIVDAILEFIPDAKVRYQEHGQDPRNYRVDFAKVRETLFFEPAFTVRDGIRELLEAMGQGFFKDISVPESFHGNWNPVFDRNT